MPVDERKQFQKELLSLAVPLALQALLTALVGATDAFILGRLNQESVAAVSLANQVMFVMTLFTGASTGGIGILAAQYLGKKDYPNLRKLMGIAVRYACIISVIFFVIARFFPVRLMGVFTDDAELIQIGASYLKIVSFSYVFTAVSGCYQMLMKAAGYARFSTMIVALTVMTDVIADIFLVYGSGSFAGFGADGSAYSTIVVEALCFAGCLIWSVRHRELHAAAGDLLFFSRKFEAEIWKLIPGLLAGSLAWGLSISMHSAIIGHLGVDAAAAYSITAVTQQLIACLTQGFANGSAIMIGTLLGSHQLDKAKRYGDRFWKVAWISGLINIALTAAACPVMCSFYVLQPLARQYLIRMLVMSAFYMFAFSFNTILTCGVFPAGGDTRYDAISVLIATWCICIPLSAFACFVLHMPVMTVYVIMCLDEIIKVPFLRSRYHKYIWVRDLTEQNGS